MTGMLMNERFVAVFPSLVRRLKSIDRAALVQTIHYEAENGESDDGWVRLTNSEWADRLGLSEDQIHRLMRWLVGKGIIERQQQTKGNYDRTTSTRIHQGFLDEAAGHPDPAGSRDQDRGIADSRSRGIADSSSLEEIENLSSTGGAADKSDNGFSKFWDLYPRKEAKAPTARSWKRLTQHEREAIFERMPHQNAKWTRDQTERRFIPLPASWLNARRWEDEIDVASNGRTAPTDHRQGHTMIMPNGEVIMT